MGKKRPKPKHNPRTSTSQPNDVNWEARVRELVREGKLPVTALDSEWREWRHR